MRLKTINTSIPQKLKNRINNNLKYYHEKEPCLFNHPFP